MDAGTILIVEDNQDNQALFRMALEQCNYHVAVASSGTEALDWLAHHPAPSLMLMDLGMPEMSGGELITRLKDHPEWRAIKVVIISGRDNLKKHARELRADGCITKPVELGALYSEISRHLN